MLRRRQFLQYIVNALALFASPKMIMSQPIENKRDKALCLFLCGDVMTGRGIDQVLPYSCDPVLYEPFVTDARRYVQLAEELNGPIKKPVDFSYIWGEALTELQRLAPDVRIINLETSVTTSGDYWPRKGIHYRMHPRNIPVINTAAIDCCVLANNHVLDWGYAGLEETLESLDKAKLKTVGAGHDLEQAHAPVIFTMAEKGRVIVFALASDSSGVPSAWAARHNRAGVNFIDEFSSESVRWIASQVRALKQPGDIVVLSIHWGSNWGYAVPDEQQEFAHRLIDEAGVDVIHGHSSHHPRPIEVYRSKLILYGCGDFINDYEGIGGYEVFRGDLSLMYFPDIDAADGHLTSLQMVPFQMRQFRLNRASKQDVKWLRDTLDRECLEFKTRVEQSTDGALTLNWNM